MPSINSYQRARILMTGATAIGFGLVWFVAARLDIPTFPRLGGSLLLSNTILSLLIVAVVYALAVVVGTVFAGFIRFNAGLVTGCLALAALSIRGGSARIAQVNGLVSVGSPGLFLRLFIELALLTLVVGACWLVLRQLYLAKKLRDREGDPDLLVSMTRAEAKQNVLDAVAARSAAGRPHAIGHELPFLATQALVTFVLILFLVRTDATFQSLISILIASFAGSAIAYQTFPNLPPRGWYWLPPLVVGLVGYVLVYFNPDGIQTANLQSTFAAFGRSLPLDYAAAGPAGAILGHWFARRWQRERDAEAAAAATPAATATPIRPA